MTETIFCLAVIFGTAYAFRSSFRNTGDKKEPEREEEQSSDTYSALSEKITTLNQMKNSIDTVNDMIADIMSCAPGEVQKAVIIKIPESGREYSFLIDGEDNVSERLIDIFEGERDKLSSSLRKEIRKIS